MVSSLVFMQSYVDDELTKKATSPAGMIKPDMSDDPAWRKQWTSGRTTRISHTLLDSQASNPGILVFSAETIQSRP